MWPMTGNETGRSSTSRPFVIHDAERAMSIDDELERAFPNSRIVHLISVRSDEGLRLSVEMLTAVDRAGADLISLNGGEGERRLRISGIGAREARSLSHRIAELPGVLDAKVEHHILNAGGL